MPLTDIEQLTKRYAQARDAVNALRDDWDEQLRNMRRYRIRSIKAATAKLAEAKSDLKNAIEAEPQLFKRPRTRVFHGVKVGLQRTKGSIQYADKNRTVELIEKHLWEQSETLIKTTKTPIAKAIENLAAKDLKRIGATLQPGREQVVIKSTDNEVEKLLAAFLSDWVDSDILDDEAAA